MPHSSMLSAELPASGSLQARFLRVRRATLALCRDLAPEDTVVQSMPETSPAKWHLAHTSWFFDQFLLPERVAPPQWAYLFNSYYQAVGPMHERTRRGLLSRPPLDEVLAYRERIDERVQELILRGLGAAQESVLSLGLQHEQQHQELLLTDIKHLFSLNPLQPVFRAPLPHANSAAVPPLRFAAGREGIVEIGHDGAGFAFDNERPRHRSLLHPHAIADRLVTNGEYLEFIRDGGYGNAGLWLSDGWNAVRERGWQRPLYWSEDLASQFTLGGRVALDLAAPVCHVSFFEADAFARWAGLRLPTEAEWERAAAALPDRSGNFVESGALQPLPLENAVAAAAPRQMFGDVWEWTSSPYVGYPGYRPLPGALGEYNGKFMCGQWVLRGGSCATPADHIRASYRNFFYPADRWQFMGFRLGRDA